MPAADWRDVVRRGASAAAPVAAPPPNPAIERLLAERRALEARMAALTGADAGAGRNPVPTMAERRAEHRQWETARATRAAAATDRVERRPVAVAADPSPPERGTPVAPRRWYAARDAALAQRRAAPTARAAPAEPRRAATPAAPPEHAVRTAPAERVRPVRAVTPVRPVGTTPKPRADRVAERMAERPAPPRPRAETAVPRPAATRPAAPAARPRKVDDAPRDRFAPDLGRAVKTAIERPAARSAARTAIGAAADRIGAKRLDKPRAAAARVVERVAAKPKAALARADRAGRGIADAWAAKRDAIAGPDLASYARGYDARAKRLLGVETGSLNDLAERTERQRQAAMGRRAEARRSEASDADRRARALDRRKNRDS